MPTDSTIEAHVSRTLKYRAEIQRQLDKERGARFAEANPEIVASLLSASLIAALTDGVCQQLGYLYDAVTELGRDD